MARTAPGLLAVCAAHCMGLGAAVAQLAATRLSLKVHAERSASAQQPPESEALLLHREREVDLEATMLTGYDCSSNPALCSAPFSCHVDPPKGSDTLATADGHADYHSWCSTPYAAAAVECAAGNLTGYARLMRQIQEDGSADQGESSLVALTTMHVSPSIVAHYCFSLGHCDNDEVTSSTTLADAEAMCDRRFGRSKWATMSADNQKYDERLVLLQKVDWRGRYQSDEVVTRFARMSCAMGNYHCDVAYCQHEFCSSPEWRAKFAA